MTMTSLPALGLVVINAKGETSEHDLRVVSCKGNYEANVLGDARQTIELGAFYGPPSKKIEATISLSVENEELRRVLSGDVNYVLVIKAKEAQ